MFVEPYPKSKALELHNDSIVIDSKISTDSTKVHFQSFIGVGPTRFIDLFSLKMSKGVDIERKKDGKIINGLKNPHYFDFLYWPCLIGIKKSL